MPGASNRELRSGDKLTSGKGNESMKVLLVEPCYENYGGYFRAYGMARGLSDAGVDVTLLISSRDNVTLKIRKEVRGEHLTVYKLPRIRINAWLTGRLLRGLIGLWFCLFGRYDLVHLFTIVQLETLVPFLFLRCLMPWRKVILDWDDYWTHTHKLMPIYKKWYIAPLRHYYRFAEYKIQQLARHMTVTSKFLGKEAAGLGIGHIHKIINGVLLEQFVPKDRKSARASLGIPDDAKMLLALGNTFYLERTMYLVKLLLEIDKLDPQVLLYTNKDLVQIWDAYNGGDKERVVFEKVREVGYLEGDRLSDYIGACDAVVFASAGTPTEKACFPTRIGTFMNAGRLVIANDVDTEACDVLREQECAVLSDSIEGLAQRAVDVLSDEAEKGRLEDNAKRAKQRLCWQQLAVALKAFYADVLEAV